MTNITLLDELGMLTTILCIVSLSAYMTFACWEFMRIDRDDHFQFIDNVIAFCMVWLVECLYIMLYSVFKSTSGMNRMIAILLVFNTLVSAAMIICAVGFCKKRALNRIPFVPVTLTASLFIIITVISNIPRHVLLDISIGIYTALSVLFSIITTKTRKSMSMTGLVYTLGGVILMIVNNLWESWWGIRFSLLLDLALSVMLTVGFFLYYSEVYSSSITEKLKKIQYKNEQLITAEEKIRNLAYKDQITRLRNIHTLQEDLKYIDPKCVHLIMVSLDYYKYFSGLDGFNRTNVVLSEIAAKLKTLTGQNDEIYHFYSDKFILLCTKEHDCCLKLVEGIKNTFRNNRFCPVELTPYIGITSISGNRRSFDALIREMELATQYSRANKLEHAFYSEELKTEFQQRLEFEINLRSAVSNKVWDIHFQPKVSVDDNSIIGAEALIRWNSETGSIPPDMFIPLAEELGLIQDIGRFVIDKTFEYINILGSMSSKRLNISINLSPYQFIDNDFVDYITETAKVHLIVPESVTFEMTESTLIHNIEQINEKINLLKELGFHFSLDDFGKGYSSISYLSRLNLDEVKFDKHFTSSLPHDERNMAILSGFMNIAKELDIHVVIEGIEKKEQYECIKEMGCNTYQGYYFSRPVPFDSLVSLLTAQP